MPFARLTGRPTTSSAPNSDFAAGMRLSVTLTVRVVPEAMVNEPALTVTPASRLVRLAATVPERFCDHGRARTETLSARPVELLIVTDVDAPGAAVVWAIDGDIEKPAATAAVGAATNAGATASPRMSVVRFRVMAKSFMERRTTT